MDQEKISQKIKYLRQKNNLTQKELADKLGVTYQAVSKWENAINIPDFATLNDLCELFSVDITYFTGQKIKQKKKIYPLIILVTIITILITTVIIYRINHRDFEFKTMKSLCSDFRINGSAAYNKDKTSIYISSISYCGEKDETIYKTIDCNLYEEYENITSLVSHCKEGTNETLEEYLNEVEINVDNYFYVCNDLSESILYLEIEVFDGEKQITYKVPITLENNC